VRYERVFAAAWVDSHGRQLIAALVAWSFLVLVSVNSARDYLGRAVSDRLADLQIYIASITSLEHAMACTRISRRGVALHVSAGRGSAALAGGPTSASNGGDLLDSLHPAHGRRVDM